MAALDVSRDMTRDDARDMRTSVGSQGAAKILRSIGWNAAMADLHLEDTSGTKLPEATTIPPRCLYMCTTRTLRNVTQCPGNRTDGRWVRKQRAPPDSS